MIASIILVGSSEIVNTFWATKLHQASYLTYTCHTYLTDALALAHRIRPDVLLIEATFDNNRGFDLAREAMLKTPALRCVMVVPINGSFWQEAIETDISGYLAAPLNDEAELLHCLDLVAQRRRYISPLLRRLTLLPQTDILAKVLLLKLRHRQVLKLLTLGKTARQIALELNLKEGTIRTYKEELVAELGVKSAAELKGIGGAVLAWLD
jgi:DNA-binding NarL/FixJ family response regulator